MIGVVSVGYYGRRNINRKLPLRSQKAICGDPLRRVFATQAECGRLQVETVLSSSSMLYSTRRMVGSDSSSNR